MDIEFYGRCGGFFKPFRPFAGNSVNPSSYITYILI